MIAPPPRPTPAPPSRAAALRVPEEDRQGLVDGILAQPLFATTRRLTGVLVRGGSRSAIFAATGSGRPAVVQEGRALAATPCSSSRPGR